MHLHIAYASDDNYAQHLAVSIVSLLENNKLFVEITIYILDNSLSEQSKKRLTNIIAVYNRNIVFYSLNEVLSNLSHQFRIPATISISAYGRLFLSSLIPHDVEKLIYADSDSIFENSLIELWNLDLGDSAIAAVEDHVGEINKTTLGLDKNFRYVNSGFLLINLKKWRKIRAKEKMITIIEKYNGAVRHHDQGVINATFHGDILYLHPKYNVMTSFFEFSSNYDIEAFYQSSPYYSKELLQEARNNPTFVHFTPGFSKRPWINRCKHPLRNRYWYYVNMTPWSMSKPENDKRPLKFKLIDTIYNLLGPVNFKKLVK